MILDDDSGLLLLIIIIIIGTHLLLSISLNLASEEIVLSEGYFSV